MSLEIEGYLLYDETEILIGISLEAEFHSESENFCWRFPHAFSNGGGGITIKDDKLVFTLSNDGNGSGDTFSIEVPDKELSQLERLLAKELLVFARGGSLAGNFILKKEGSEVKTKTPLN